MLLLLQLGPSKPLRFKQLYKQPLFTGSPLRLRLLSAPYLLFGFLLSTPTITHQAQQQPALLLVRSHPSRAHGSGHVLIEPCCITLRHGPGSRLPSLLLSMTHPMAHTDTTDGSHIKAGPTPSPSNRDHHPEPHSSLAAGSTPHVGTPHTRTPRTSLAPPARDPTDTQDELSASCRGSRPRTPGTSLVPPARKATLIEVKSKILRYN